MPENANKILYVERMYGKTQSVVLGGNLRHHCFVVR